MLVKTRQKYLFILRTQNTVPSSLGACKNCLEVFYYDDDSIKYAKPLEIQIADLKCPTCDFPLKENFIEYNASLYLKNCNSPKPLFVDPNIF
jgi:hypothetical protein